ncbi:hypothetical protein [Aneurinibacillus sp. UBA3580]|uniref:hypothetical protein n=1 Tax=Aneurinibacillus sp. UBA3580 TaxID=1946041 RepID=UPI00257E77D1|nr:hypothetical protein [Aneurinibacillus sp. UBA3580]
MERFYATAQRKASRARVLAHNPSSPSHRGILLWASARDAGSGRFLFPCGA